MAVAGMARQQTASHTQRSHRNTLGSRVALLRMGREECNRRSIRRNRRQHLRRRGNYGRTDIDGLRSEHILRMD